MIIMVENETEVYPLDLVRFSFFLFFHMHNQKKKQGYILIKRHKKRVQIS